MDFAGFLGELILLYLLLLRAAFVLFNFTYFLVSNQNCKITEVITANRTFLNASNSQASFNYSSQYSHSSVENLQFSTVLTATSFQVVPFGTYRERSKT